MLPNLVDPQHQQQHRKQHKDHNFPSSLPSPSSNNNNDYNNNDNKNSSNNNSNNNNDNNNKIQNNNNESDSLHSDSISSDLEECNTTSSNTDDCSKRNNSKGSGRNQPNDDDEEKIQLATKETQAVFRLRLIVLSVLLLASLAVSLIVYNITSNSLEEQTSSDFQGAAKKVTETFLEIAEIKIAALASFAVAVIANSQDMKQDWPFVTLSNFQQRAITARSQSGALNLMLVPLVDAVERAQWQEFVQNESSWIEEGMRHQEDIGLFDFLFQQNNNFDQNSTPPPYDGDLGQQQQQQQREMPPTGSIWYYNDQDEVIMEDGPGPYLPIWQVSPIFNDGQDVGENLYRLNLKEQPSEGIENPEIIITEFITAPPGDVSSSTHNTALFAALLGISHQKVVTYQGDAMSMVSIPIFDSFLDNRKPVALLVSWIHWASYFESVLPDSVQGIIMVLSNTCGGEYTYEIQGENVKYVGAGDLHPPEFEHEKRSTQFHQDQVIEDGTKFGYDLDQVPCNIGLDVYPSHAFYDSYDTKTPITVTIAVAIIFVFTAFLFVIYDRLVERRQALVLKKALQSTAIVSSLFPENVRDRLMNGGSDEDDAAASRKYPTSDNHKSPLVRNKRGTVDGLNTSGGLDKINLNAPIADLFPYCTVSFTDIAGFTAWSSTREPAQVFVLLQSLYQAFDLIAKRRQVFKVETIGDSYVAVTGLPKPQSNHAIIMARFASECMTKMRELMSELESSLGPDTADLTVRIGLHSGQVTAGVLKGDRARFQLFGDTVNTASRMESTGVKGKIQISQETHDLLVEAGKSHWVTPREDVVMAKGKGTLRTYWLQINSSKAVTSSVNGSSTTGNDSNGDPELAPRRSKAVAEGLASIKKLSVNMAKQDRLIDWMADMMKEQLEKVLAQRGTQKSYYKPQFSQEDGKISLDEVTEVILIPKHQESCHLTPTVSLVDPDVHAQLREYVGIIASTYRNNPFHNFEHACHVTMAVNKFIKRIVSTTSEEAQMDNNNLATLYDYTHSIHSDPLTVLAILLSALVHDADHRGVSNMQLGIEEPEMASIYRNKSIAEQNSLDIAWDLLMSDQFAALQAAIFASEEDLKRFRQVLVNVVLATDIFDKEINDVRKKRWNKAFAEEFSSDPEINNLRATIVIEHIIQASDVAHTMQHWHVYRKWNKRLFTEMHVAYKAGRMGKDPRDFWYQGELGFFDNYIIPLSKKLKDCNVFGVSSDECLNYAIKNRAEWENHGQDLLAEMVAELHDGRLEI